MKKITSLDFQVITFPNEVEYLVESNSLLILVQEVVEEYIQTLGMNLIGIKRELVNIKYLFTNPMIGKYILLKFIN